MILLAKAIISSLQVLLIWLIVSSIVKGGFNMIDERCGCGCGNQCGGCQGGFGGFGGGNCCCIWIILIIVILVCCCGC